MQVDIAQAMEGARWKSRYAAAVAECNRLRKRIMTLESENAMLIEEIERLHQQIVYLSGLDDDSTAQDGILIKVDLEPKQ